MHPFKWFSRNSPLQFALQRGLAEGGSLTKELGEVGDYKVKARADALAICQTLQLVIEGRVARGNSSPSPLHALTLLFQDVESAECDAFPVLQERGTALLVKILDQGLSQEGVHSTEDLLFVLKVLATYGTAEGASAVLRAARKPLAPDRYLWAVILGAFEQGHPELTRVLGELGDPLPGEFLAIALLDAANRFFLDGGEMRHPFDSDEGIARLETWLRDSNPEYASYAISATAAIPFLNHDGSQRLLTLALQHASASVVLEAAWAAAKIGDERGIEALARSCLDLNRSAQAQEYLEELGRGDAVPQAARAPDFKARAEFAQWLAHPNELGRVPDEVEILDHRELRWPPEFQPKPFWLIRYCAKAQTDLEQDDVGVGLVGSSTFCFFSYNLLERPPEDAYAIHCCWELDQAKLLNYEEVDEDSTEYNSLLAQWTGPQLDEPRIEHVVELDPALKRSRRLIGVASAKLDGANGWVVLDGPQSCWYPAEEMPRNERASHVMKIHVGRSLLGLAHSGSRKAWLKAPGQRPPERIVAAYETLLSEFEYRGTKPRADLTNAYRLINGHFKSYVDAACAVRGGTRERHLVTAYERVLRLATEAEPSLGDGAWDVFSAICERFESYSNALVALGRHSDMKSRVEFLAPRWQHNLGYRLLGAAAFKAGEMASAESFLVKLKEGLEDWPRTKEMALLADIWFQRGERDQARSLLLQCLKRVLEESRKSTGYGRRSCEMVFLDFRNTFLKFFPDDAARLAAEGIPETTRRKPR